MSTEFFLSVQDVLISPITEWSIWLPTAQPSTNQLPGLQVTVLVSGYISVAQE